MDTTRLAAGAVGRNKKGRAFTRPFGTFRAPGVSRSACYFGGSAFGVAGLGAAVPVGFEGTGFVAAPAAGAGTPDCVLYISTTALVMSTPSPAISTGLCGHCLEVSRILPKPCS